MSRNWGNSSLLSVKELTRIDFEEVFQQAKEILPDPDLFKGKIASIMFFEPSTRTRFSFTSAMMKLGGEVIDFTNPEMTSIKKGETLIDTLRMFQNYVDIVIIRYPGSDELIAAASEVSIPIINAGDGTNEHPTQALLDLYTIQEHFGKIDGMRIAIIGELLYSRPVHSLALSLAKFRDIKMRLIAPKGFSLPTTILQELERESIQYEQTEDLNFADVDVVYTTRVHAERFTDKDECERIKGSYRLTKEIVKRKLSKDAVIMCALPKTFDQVDPGVDELKQAIYFKQAGNGIPVRMALLKMILS